MKITYLSVLLCFALSLTDLHAQSVEIVADINTTANFGTVPENTTNFGDELYFSYDDGQSGNELWKIDGAGDWVQVKDLTPGLGSSNPKNLMVFDGNLYFTIQDPINTVFDEGILYRTDGTSEGTVLVHEDLNHYGNLTAGASELYFAGGDGSSFTPNRELWKTDGTTLGTTLVKSINESASEGSDPESLFYHNSLLYFSADDGTNGRELWVSDGTELGTIMILDRSDSQNDSGNPNNFQAIGSDVYFSALSASFSNQGVWVTDGTIGGTSEIRSLASTNSSSTLASNRLKEWNGYLFYWDRSGGSGSRNLYSYDGVTERLIDNEPSFIAFTLAEGVGDSLYYSKGGSSLRATNGLAADDSDFLPSSTATTGSETYFISGLKVFDYNAGDPTEIGDLAQASGSMVAVGSDVYFTDSENLFKISGGAFLVETNNLTSATSDAAPNNLIVFEGNMYFEASDGSTTNLYVSDGTEMGTEVVVGATPMGDRTAELNGLLYYETGGSIYSFDGTTQTLIQPSPTGTTGMVASGSNIFITDNTLDPELHVFDGTNAPVKLDLVPGSGGSQPTNLYDVDGTLFFVASDPSIGQRGLWKSDGTPEGTEVVFSRTQGGLENVHVFGDSLFFTAFSSIPNEYNLYTSDASGEVSKIRTVTQGLQYPMVAFEGDVYLGFGNSLTIIRDDGVESTGHVSNSSSLTLDALSSSLLVRLSHSSTFLSKQGIISEVQLPVQGSGGFMSFGPSDIIMAGRNIIYTDGTQPGTETLLESLSVPNVIRFNGETYLTGSLDGSGTELLKVIPGTVLTPTSDLEVVAGTDPSIAEVTLTQGTGDGRLILAFQEGDLSYPEDGVTYTATPMIGTTDTIEEGMYVLNAADESTLSVSGIVPGEEYTFMVIEYSDQGGGNLAYDRAQAETATYTASKLDQTIDFTNPGDVSILDGTVDLIAEATSGLDVSFSLTSAPSGAFLADDNTINLGTSATGEFTVVASQAGDDTYNAAPSVEITFNSVKADPQIVFEISEEEHEYGQVFTLPSASSVVPVTTITPFVESGPATITNGNVVITGIGEVVFGAGYPGNTFYEEDTIYDAITVVKGTQFISNTFDAEQVFGFSFAINFTTVPSSSVNEPAGGNYPGNSYEVTNIIGPATITAENGINPQIEITGTGAVFITVVNNGNDFWEESNPLVIDFDVIKADQILTLNNAPVVSYSLDPFSLDGVVSSNVGLPVSYSVLSGPGSISDGNSYLIDATGTVEVQATSAETDNYNSAGTSFSFDVTKGDQAITFVLDVNELTYQEGLSLTLGATASSALPVTYESTGTGVGNIMDGVLNVTQAGSFSITASQAGDDNWNSATSVIQAINVARAQQVITVEEVPDKIRGDEAFELVASSTSGLVLSIGSATGLTTVDGNTISINAAAPAGLETITLNQSGNENYLAAGQEQVQFCISPPKPTISELSDNVLQVDNAIDVIDWYLDGVLLTTTNISTLTVDQSGSYTAVAMAGNGCSNSEVSDAFVYETPLGLGDDTGIEWYPNPVVQELKLNLGDHREATLTLVDAKGIVVLSKELTQQTSEVQLGDLSPGVYVLHLSGKNLDVSQTIIKAN